MGQMASVTLGVLCEDVLPGSNHTNKWIAVLYGIRSQGIFCTSLELLLEVMNKSSASHTGMLKVLLQLNCTLLIHTTSELPLFLKHQ